MCKTVGLLLLLLVSTVFAGCPPGEDQQVITLYERSIDTPADQLGEEVARKTFINQDAGETNALSFSRNWSSCNEFSPEYILVIGYDPSNLYQDGNLYNEYTNHDNDKIVVSGSGINVLF